jgi:hypothetical protein
MWFVAATVPAAAIGLGLAWYNYARFGSVTEFGLRYILSGVYEAKIDHFRLRYLTWNAWSYLAAPVAWTRYFPFLHELPIARVRPWQHYGMDHPFGLLANVPFLWCVAFVLCLRPKGPDALELRRVVGELAITAGAMLALLLCFYAAMARYLADFAPMLALLAVVGALEGLRRVRETRRARRVFVPLLAVVGVGSVAVVGFFGCEIYGQFRAESPTAFERLARVFNAPVHLVEALGDRPRGPIDFVIRISPQAVAGERALLVQTGYGSETDRVLLVREDAGHIHFEFEHAGAAPRRSASFEAAPGSSHRVSALMGGLLPPLSSPAYANWTPAQRRLARRQLQVRFDDADALSAHLGFYDSTPATEIIARGRARACEIVSVERRPIEAAKPRGGISDGDAAARADVAGTWRLLIQFPERPVNYRREPILVTGQTERGDFIAVEYVAKGRARFVFDHWGKRAVLSPEFEFVPGKRYPLQVWHRSYGTDPGSGRGSLRVELGDALNWAIDATMYRTDPLDRYVGVNPIGGSGCADRFSGRIEADPAPGGSARGGI